MPVLMVAYLINKTTTSAIIWRGGSLIDGGNVAAIISGMFTPSANDKTGAMAQLTIIKTDEDPIAAMHSGGDFSICGNCKFRKNPTTGARRCYVNLGQSILKQYQTLSNAKYPTISPHDASLICRANRKNIRLGAYGDMAAIPQHVIRELLAAAGTRSTAYSHQWREDYFDPSVLNVAMASVDSIDEVLELRRRFPNARHYRTAENYNDLMPDEIPCPSKNRTTGERVLQCDDCLLCDGSLKAKNIVIALGD